MKYPPLHFIITGGTIDSYFDGIKDNIVPLKKTVVPDFIKSLQLEDPIQFTEVCMKDSRSLNTQDLKDILEAVKKSKADHIIITHGTYTMPDTARFLATNLKISKKVIILTGSMIPITGFSPSDAPFNLGYAIASSKTLKPGIYVCMNGQIFSPNEVAKRISEGRFVSIFNKI